MSEPVGTLSDAALVRAAQAGDSAGLGVLLERHRARLHAIAVSIVGHGPAAEDAVQETFLIALRRIGELRDPAAARAWLAAILVNVCRGELRRPSARVEAGTGVSVSELAGPDTATRAIDDGALRDWVWTALERLSEPLRLAVMLRYFTGASSYEAIAEVCGVPVGTVRSRLSAAKAKLADELLETAATAHDDLMACRRRSLEVGEAYTRLERDGDLSALDGVVTRDVAFVMFDRVERRGARLYAEALTRDFEDGVRSRLRQAIPGREISIVELWLDSPPEQPLHCPPAVTQVQFHRDGPTSRIVSYYAPRPDAAGLYASASRGKRSSI
jgi:RNA polymerase sigma-70 factor (ECF subfamily)